MDDIKSYEYISDEVFKQIQDKYYRLYAPIYQTLYIDVGGGYRF